MESWQYLQNRSHIYDTYEAKFELSPYVSSKIVLLPIFLHNMYMRSFIKPWLRTKFHLYWSASHQCQQSLAIAIAADLWLMLQRSSRTSQGRIWWNSLKHIVPTKTVIQFNLEQVSPPMELLFTWANFIQEVLEVWLLLNTVICSLNWNQATWFLQIKDLQFTLSYRRSSQHSTFLKKTKGNTHPLKYSCAEKLPDHASMWRE